MTSVLLVGESWVSISTHYKGFNHFVSGIYETGIKWFKAALMRQSIDLVHMPAHIAANDFPFDKEELDYDAIILSDIGADSFLLHPKTWLHGDRMPNRLEIIKDYVEDGGGLIMVGGYMSFQGINGAAMYQRTPIAEVLPVNMMISDDRCERPEGVTPIITCDHSITSGLPQKWPYILGYQCVEPKKGSKVLVSVDKDPLLVVGEYGKGRAIAYTTDIGPHWCPREFAEWKGYEVLWSSMIRWVSGY